MKCRKAVMLALAILICAQAALGQAWREEINRALENKATYDFKSIAMTDVLRIVGDDAEINVILDSGAGAGTKAKLTFAVKDMTLTSVLCWSARLTELEWCVQDEAVFMTKSERMSTQTRREVERRNLARRAEATKTWLPAMQEKLSQKWSVKFEEKPLADCRESLKALMGINIVVSPKVDARAPVELDVSKMSGESIISWVVRKAGVDYAILDEAVYFSDGDEIRAIRFAGLDLSSEGRAFEAVSFEFNDTPLDEAIRSLSAKAGVEITLRNASGMLPRVTFSGKDMPLTKALQNIVSRTGLIAAIVPEGEGLTVSLMKPAMMPAVPGTMTGPSTDAAVNASDASEGAGGSE